MHQWDGVSLLWEREWLSDEDALQPHTDACSTGYGAICGRQWFHAQWTDEQQQWSQADIHIRESMPFKELYALVAAAATWGHLWNRKRITFRTDCLLVVMALNKGTSSSKMMMQLIRFLHYHAAQHHSNTEQFIYLLNKIPLLTNSHVCILYLSFRRIPCRASTFQ